MHHKTASKPRQEEEESPCWTINPAFDPRRSLLGRYLSARLNDPLRAETVLIFSTAAVILVLVAAANVAWVLNIEWRQLSLNSAAGVTAGVLAVTALAFVAGGLLGWSPRIDVQFSPEAIHVASREKTMAIPFADIRRAETIPARVFHRHYRRYRETATFVNRLPNEVLLVWAGSRPVIIGLPGERHAAFLDALNRRLAAAPGRPETAPALHGTDVEAG